VISLRKISNTANGSLTGMFHDVHEGAAGIRQKTTAEGEYTSRFRTVVVSQQPLVHTDWRETMKTMVACVLGLAAFATSFASGGSPAYADALEISALPILAAGADANDVGDQLHCVFYSDGADNCVVNVQLEAFGQQSAAAGEIDMSATKSPPAVQFVDAIPVVVVQTVTIAAPGSSARKSEETAYTPPLRAPATEPILDVDAKTTTGALLLPPDSQSGDAIAVAIVQSATVAVRGQSAMDSEAAAQAESMSGPTAPISVRRAKATAPDDEE